MVETKDAKETTAVSKPDSEYEKLLSNVGDALSRGRQRVASFVGAQTVATYWEIGKYIVEYEQNGHEKAEYGSEVLNRLSRDMTERYGRGFSHSNLVYIRKLYLTYQKSQTLSDFLTWSHYVELLKIDDPLERSFYEKEAEAEHWGVRELKRQMNSMLFQRLALSTDKDSVMKLAQEGQIIEKPEDILKEPFVFEFTGLPQLPTYDEGDIEEALINNLSLFFLELGKGFTYIGNQHVLEYNGKRSKVDMLFFHRGLHCLVAIDLKIGEFRPEYAGKMNYYLSLLDRLERREDEKRSIGIILCAEKDRVEVELALEDMGKPIGVADYQLIVPQEELKKVVAEEVEAFGKELPLHTETEEDSKEGV